MEVHTSNSCHLRYSQRLSEQWTTVEPPLSVDNAAPAPSAVGIVPIVPTHGRAKLQREKDKGRRPTSSGDSEKVARSRRGTVIPDALPVERVMKEAAKRLAVSATVASMRF
jgi:hypothetical protein